MGKKVIIRYVFIFLLSLISILVIFLFVNKSASYASYTQQLSEKIHSEVLTNSLNRIGVYLYDFRTGKELGYHENDIFYPASMLKVVALMALYKEAQDDPSILKQGIGFYGTYKPKQNIQPELQLQPNMKYSVEEVARRMITYSDNSAYMLLLKFMKPTDVIQAYKDLVQIDIQAKHQTPISAKQYSIILKTLYNATYISRVYSNLVIKLLEQTKYSEGIIAGLPKSVPVAHKFGERTYTKSDKKQLHDCGIIYYPDKPYLLCIMTEGKDQYTEAKAIQHISEYVYKTIATL